MTTPASPAPPDQAGSLEEFLAPADIAALDQLGDDAWNRLRGRALRQLAWRFCTPRNLWHHRGRYLCDGIGFGWGGIYRSLRVGSIVTTSFRNEGHFRAGERILGTSDFFSGAFRLATASADLGELVRAVNLRHHVAGVVRRQAGGVQVLPRYEADYAYVATAFIESLRRGYAACGIPADSRRGREIGGDLGTILYQVAGLTGLARRPRDLAAHERFRDAYERRLADHPPSPRVRRMAQEIARRIMPLTAAMCRSSVRDHAERHLDPATRELLFPAGNIPAELEPQREAWAARIRHTPALLDPAIRLSARRGVWQRPDIAPLLDAYRLAPPELTADRLIGAILLQAIDAAPDGGRPYERRSVELAPGEALIRQGERPGEMYVVLSTTAPLIVTRRLEEAAEPLPVATLAAPTVLGEIGMWRGQPAVATVLTREPNRLDLLVVDAERFTALKQESGFRAATAAEVQRRLALNSSLIGRLLDDAAAGGGDPLVVSIAQLFRYLTGDSHVSLDAVIGLPDDATPAECVEALRKQVDDKIRGGGLPPDLERFLGHIVATIG